MDIGNIVLGFIAAMPALIGIANGSAGALFVGAIFSGAAFFAWVYEPGGLLIGAALWFVGVALALSIVGHKNRIQERRDSKSLLAAVRKSGRKLTADDCEHA